MSRYRVVFITPPTINKRAHRRSKTHPLHPQYKTELSHHPRGEGLSPVYSYGAPSLPCLLKEVNLRFKPEQRREISEVELPTINSPRENKFEDSPRNIDTGKEFPKGHSTPRYKNIEQLQCSPRHINTNQEAAKDASFPLNSPSSKQDRPNEELLAQSSPFELDKEEPEDNLSLGYGPSLTNSSKIGQPDQERRNISARIDTDEIDPVQVPSDNSRSLGTELQDRHRPSDSTDKVLDERQSLLIPDTFRDTVDGQSCLDSDSQLNDARDGVNCLYQELPQKELEETQTCPYSDFRILPKTPIESKHKSKDRFRAKRSKEKKVLTFGKTVFPDGFESDSNLDSETYDEEEQDSQPTEEIENFELPNYQNPFVTQNCPIESPEERSQQNPCIENIKQKEKQTIVPSLNLVSENQEVCQVSTQQEENEVVEEHTLIPIKPTFILEDEASEDKPVEHHSPFEASIHQEPLTFQETLTSITETPAKIADSENDSFDINQPQQEQLIHQEPLTFQEGLVSITENPTKTADYAENRVFENDLVDNHRPQEARVGQEPDRNQEKFASISGNTKKALKPDLILESDSVVDSVHQEKFESIPDHFILTGQSDSQSTPRELVVENNLPGKDTFDQEVSTRLEKLSPIPRPNTIDNESTSPFTNKGPIIFHFESEDKNKEEQSLEDSGIASFNGIFEESDNHSEQVAKSPNRELSYVCVEGSDQKDSSEPLSNAITSTPASKSEAVERRLFENPLQFQDISHIDFDKDSSYNEQEIIEDIDLEEDKMASLPPQNVKAKAQLLESKEKIRQLEEKLAKEQKLTENKEKTITSLTKELKKMEEQKYKDNNNNPNNEEIKSRVISLETDNRILVNQVKMVEEANKQLYKELYEKKTQLHFQERRTEDSSVQNTQTARRLSQTLQSSMDKSTGYTVFLHQMETDLISTESALRKLRAQRQALEEVLESDEEKTEVPSRYPFSREEKESFLTEEVKAEIQAQLKSSLDRDFEDEASKQQHCDERITDLEYIINECISSKFKTEKDRISASQKKIDLARVHVRAIKDIENKCLDIKHRSENQISTMKKRISNEVKELSKEISGMYLSKQEQKRKPRRKISTLESPEAIRKKSVEEIANIDRALRTMRSKYQVTHDDLSENEKEIMSLNEKMSKNLDDKIQMSDELLDTQSKIKQLENRYEDKQKEAENLERELSAKRNEINEMAKEMQEALSHISTEKIGDDFEKSDSNKIEKSERVVQFAEKEVQVNDLNDELVHTIFLLETEQKEREEALRMNEDLFLELENREHEISNLVMELEQLKEKHETSENSSDVCKRLKELTNSIEPASVKDDLVQLEKDLQDEMYAKEMEVNELNIELTKQKQDAESLMVLIDYYKDEMALLQKEKGEKTDSNQTDEGNGQLNNPNLLLVANAQNDQAKLRDDIVELQKALASEVDAAKEITMKITDLEEALRKERQAKDYAYQRNRHLEEELRIKDVKLSNFASAVGVAQIEQHPVRESATATTISDLRAAMTQIQSENKSLSSEVDSLANDMKNNSADNAQALDSQNKIQTDLPNSGSQTDEADEKDGQYKKETSPSQHLAHSEGISEVDGPGNEQQSVANVVQNEQPSVAPQDVASGYSVEGISNDEKSGEKTAANEVKEYPESSDIIQSKNPDVVESTENSLFCENNDQHVHDSTKQHKDNRGINLATEKDKIVHELEHTIQTLKQEVETLKSENALLENEAVDILDDGLKVENKILRNQVSRLSNELAIARADEDDLKREFEHVENRSKEMQEALVKLTSAKNETLYSNENLTFQNKILNEELVLLRNKIEVLEDEVEVITGEVVGIEVVDSKAFVQENEALKTDIAKITLALDINKEEAEGLRSELEVSEGKVKELEGKLASLNKEKSRLEIMVDDLSFKNKTQEKEMNLWKKKIGVLEEEIQFIEQDLKQRSDEVKDKEVAIENIEKENATKEHEKKELENIVKEKEKALELAKIAEEKQLKHLVEKNFNLQAQLNKHRMNSSESRQEQQRLEKDLNELRDRLREADRKFNTTREEKLKNEGTLGSMESRVGILQKDLSDAKSEIREKNEVIRKLNLKNSELQIMLAEREEELRREERLRMDNMKSLDTLKIKLEKMESDEKKNRDRLFSLKSACSEANEAYEIVKNQNLNLRNDMQETKKKLSERVLQNESNKREKEQLQEQILNASRTMDDIRKYAVARDESLSPDSALGISVTSLTDLGSGPSSPNSDISDSLFTAGDEDMKVAPQEQQGLLYKMPTMIENFRAVVRDNELMRTKLAEVIGNKDKINSQMKYYSTMNDELQQQVGEKDLFLGELQTKTKMLEDELYETKNSLNKTERDFSATASEADLIKTTLKVREETVSELREKVELLEEKEKALELYSKSMSEKYHHEVAQKNDCKATNKSLNEKNQEQNALLENLEKKLSEYSSRRRVSEPEVMSIVAPVQQKIAKKASELAMGALEGKLESIVEYSEVLESSLMDVEIEYRSLQAENERLKREMVEKDEYEGLKTSFQQKEESFKDTEEDLQRKINSLEDQLGDLERQNDEKESSMQSITSKERDLAREYQKLKDSFSPLEEANCLLKAELDSLKEDSKHGDETRFKMDNDLKLVKTKMVEIEMTTEAYKEENSRLRSDIIALSEEKCDVECKVSEAERREKRLNDLIHQERTERQELKAEHETTLGMCNALQGDLVKAKDTITKLEAEQNKTEQTNNEMESRLNDITTQKATLSDELQIARKDLQDLEDRYKKTVDQEEALGQKVNKLGLDNSRLQNAYEQSQKRKNDLERELVQANGKNEDFEAEMENIRIEKAGLLKEIAQKEETVESMETKKSELEEERQKLNNDLYLSTKKVLSLQLNLESLRNDVTQLGKDLRRLVLGTIGREARDETEEKSMEADLEMSLFENEVVVQALRQTIKATERSLDFIRPEAKVSELESKLCQKDIDSVHREFAFLKDQLASFRHSCQKLSDESKRLKEDLYNKEATLQETREQCEAMKEENTDNKDILVELQSKCNSFEMLTAEYEQNAETAHNEIVRANQTIAALEATVTKQEQKRNAMEKERLVMQERLNNLENNQRASKDEIRTDKKRIASLEVESTEKQGLARELEKIENNFNELKLKYDDALKEREEVRAELVTIREELRQEELELKNSKKDVENFKKHIVIEREMRQRVEQDLSEHVEELKTSKKNIHTLERSQNKLQDENETLQEKAKLLEETAQTFKKQLEVQTVEMKRLKDSLTDTRNELMNTNERHEMAEKERKRYLEDLIHSEEQIRKFQDTCNELLKEKSYANEKVSSLSDTLDSMITSHEDAVHNLKADIMGANKDLSITKSSLERSQIRNNELLKEIKIQQDKMKAMEEKKQELLEKFWESQNHLGDAQSGMDSLTAETKDLKGRIAIHLSKIDQLEEALRREHEESENTIESLNNKISDLKNQRKSLSQERDMLQEALQQTEEALTKTSEELKYTAKNLAEKEKLYNTDVSQRNQTIDNLKNISEAQRVDLKKTKDTLREVHRENEELKENLETTQKALDGLESKVNDQDNHNVDTLAEAQAKLKVVSKMKASNSGENFVDLQSAPLLGAELESFDNIDGPLDSGRDASIKDIVDAFHQTCMYSFNDNRDLQDKLSRVNESNAILEESLHKERNIMAETKRYLHETEKKKTKLEEEVKKLRKRLDIFKQKSIELEKCKDDELCELKGDKAILDKENWVLKEAVEELRAKNKETETERDRYADEIVNTQRQVIEARADIKHAQEQIDSMQEQLFDMKKRGFELEAREKSLQQQVAEKEKELYANEMKVDELEKLYNTANEKKTELYTKMSKAEDKIREQESKSKETETENKQMAKEISNLKSSLSEMKETLTEATDEADQARDKIEELEIQRGSLQASNEILKHQLELLKSENEALKKSYTSSHDESLNLSKALNDATINSDNLQTDIKRLCQEKERLQDALNVSESQLREAEDNLVKAFQDGEHLKRQMLKVQSTACAESVKLQGEFSKMKSELESTKRESNEKDKDYMEKNLKLKSTEKELENLRKDLNNIHMRESELKLDYTTANSKLHSYVLERECWEREVKTVLGEIEQQKNLNTTKEHRLERLRMRYEQEIGFLSQRVSSLERELKIVQDAAEQQRHADDIAHKLNIEAKDMEIDNLRMRLQATRIHTSDKNTVVDQMKNQLEQRTSQINDLMGQMGILKDSYNLELASVQADLKCSQMENLLKLRKDMGPDNQLSTSPDSVSDLLEAIKSSRKESERLRHLLGNRMRQMNTLNRDISSKRSLGPEARSYSLYSRDNEGHLRD